MGQTSTQPAPRTDADAIAFVHKVMAAVQPELMTPKNIVRVTEESHVSVYKPFSAEYLVTIKNFFAPEGYNGSGPPRFAMPWRPPDETYLKASVRMMRGVFVEYGGWPDAVRAKREEYDRLVREHPEWSDDDAARALTEQLGARFGRGSERELQKHLPLTQLAALIGKIRVTGEPKLTLRARQNHDGEPDRYLGLGSWGLSIAVTTRGTERIYRVSVEPFEGRIVDIFTDDYRAF